MAPSSAAFDELVKNYYIQKPNFAKLDNKKDSNNTENEIIQKIKEALNMTNPTEGNTTGNVTDRMIKNPSDSSSSEHKNVTETLHTMAHKANPGPVISDNIGKPESKEALKARSEELNK